MRLTQLTQLDTAIALAKRKIYMIRCCGRPMFQDHVQTRLPSEELDYGRSVIHLRCNTCDREIVLESLTGPDSTEKVWDGLKKELKEIYGLPRTD